jgi:hypothetical protein
MLKFIKKTFMNFSKGLQRIKIEKFEKKQSFSGLSQRSMKKNMWAYFCKGPW